MEHARRGDIVIRPGTEARPLDDLIREHVPWERIRAPIPSSMTALLWALVVCDGVVTGWLIQVRRGALGCSGPLCEAATFSGHPTTALGLAAGSLWLMIAMAFASKGFTLASEPILWAICAGAGVAVVTVAGPIFVGLALAALAALTLALLVTLIGAVLSR